MQNQPLPRRVEVRKLAAAGAEISATEAVSAFPRFVEGLSDDSGEVAIELHFYVDAQGVLRVDGHLRTRVQVTCQRCMQSMSLPLDSTFAVGLVWGESQLQALPKELESVVMDTEDLDLLPLVEDELIVSMPIVAFHDEEECEGAARAAFPPPEATEDEAERENPFAVLEQLKSGDKHDRD